MGERLSSEVVVQEFVEAFIAAWPSGSVAALAPFFSEQAEYRNGPVPPVQGRVAIADSLAQMMGLGGEVDVEMVHLLTDDTVVMTERIDYVKLGQRTAGLRIAGVFEVHDGVITGWRDYFDPNEFMSQLSTD